MLKAQVLDAVRQAKVALQDLAIDGLLVRSTKTHVPGSAPTVANVQEVPIKYVIVDFEVDEIDGDRIVASDLKAILFNDALDPQAGDVLREVPAGKSYNLLPLKPIKVGDTVAVTQVRLRPT